MKLSVNGLRFSYSDKPIINDLSLTPGSQGLRGNLTAKNSDTPTPAVGNGGQHRRNARKNDETARPGYGADRKGHRQGRKGHYQERPADSKDGTAHRKGHRENRPAYV